MKLWRLGLVGLVGALGACAHGTSATSGPEQQVVANQSQSGQALQRAADAQAKADKASAAARAAEQKVQDDQKQLAEDQSIAQTRSRDAHDKKQWLSKLQQELGQPGQGYSAGQSNVAPVDQQRLDKAQRDATDTANAAENANNKVADDSRRLDDDRTQARTMRQRAIAEQQNATQVAQAAVQQAQQHQQAAVQAQQQQAQFARQNMPTVTGSISTINGSELIVVPKGGGTPLRLQAGQNTIVTLNGKRASIGDLPQGADVRASYRPGSSEDQGLPVAARIDAHSSRKSSNQQQNNSNSGDQGAIQP